jgi:phosphoribosylanthranilate isomerase
VKINKRPLQIKVCGMRDPRNLEQVCSLSPEFIGFIFYPPSKRFVGSTPDPALFDIPGPDTRTVGVFVNEDLKQVGRVIKKYRLDAVQLHGSESEEYCSHLSGDVMVIKAIVPLADRSEIEKYQGVADLILFDSPGDGFGGTGRKFDWGLLDNLQMQSPFFLSGGIGPGDAGALRNLELGGLTGIDINSRFEISPGQKDTDLLKQFLIQIRK